MHKNLIALFVLATILIVGRIVTSDDTPRTHDQPPTLEPIDQEQLTLDQLEVIADVRATNDLEFLRGEENDQLFEAALQDHAALDTELFVEQDQLSALPDAALEQLDSTRLEKSLLDAAMQLNQRAHALERNADHLAADKCRHLAEALRLEVRTLQKVMHR